MYAQIDIQVRYGAQCQRGTLATSVRQHDHLYSNGHSAYQIASVMQGEIWPRHPGV